MGQTYVMSYFTTDEESLFLASSEDGYEFTPVNNGRPVLRGQVGTRTLRDPFVGVGPDGRFHLLATDGWRSTSIVHATSDTLLDWSRQRLIPVMADVDGAANAWAPEFFVDRHGQAHLIWSSVVDVTSEPGDLMNITHEHRIWGTRTSDFTSFEPARMIFDPGHSVIDATVHTLDGGFLMAYKDERGVNDLDTSHKHINTTTFADPWTDFTEPRIAITPSPVEGPSLFRREAELVLLYDRFLEDGYGAISSTDLVTWRVAEVKVPVGARHASVLQIPYERLRW